MTLYLLFFQILEGKKLLKIATDQIKGLRERMFTLEEENRCLRATCASELVSASVLRFSLQTHI